MEEREGQSDSELELSSRLLRALSHRIRGDLSVVTNDLVYLSSVVDPAELERPKARCANIAASLASLGSLTSSTKRERSRCSLLAEILLLKLDPSVDPEREVCIDKTRLQDAVRLLRQLLGSWSGVIRVGVGGREDLECSIRFERTSTLQEVYSSVGRLAAAELGERFVVEGCLIDLIVRDHSWLVRFSRKDDSLVGTITVPGDKG